MNPREGAAALVRRMLVSSLDAGAQTRRVSTTGGPSDDQGNAYAISGTTGGKPHQALVDWEGPGGEASLERIRRLGKWKKALGMDAVFLCCDQGFPAERMLAAIKEGVHLVEVFPRGRARLHTGSATLVRHVGIEEWTFTLADGANGRPGYSFDSRSAHGYPLFCEKPVQNWLCRSSRKLLRMVAEDCILKAKYVLKRPLPLTCDGRILETSVLEAWYECRCRTRLHSACIELARAAYEPRRKRFYDRTGEPGDTGTAALHDEALEFEGAVPAGRPDQHVFHPVRSVEGAGTPELDDCIASVKVSMESGKVVPVA